MKYQEGTFGYWWTVLEGKEDIKNKNYHGDIVCKGLKLASLEGAPKKIDGNFFCQNNRLKTLEGAPKIVIGDFWCFGNDLKTLEGAPEKIEGDFFCYNNDLTSLVGIPKIVGDHFNCKDNPDLIAISDIIDAFDSDIGKFISDIMSDTIYQEYRKLYMKMNKNKFLKYTRLRKYL